MNEYKLCEFCTTSPTIFPVCSFILSRKRRKTFYETGMIKQLLDEVAHDIMNYQNRGLCYLPRPKAEADNTDTRF